MAAAFRTFTHDTFAKLKELIQYDDTYFGFDDVVKCKMIISQALAEFFGTFLIMCPLWLVLHPESNYFLHTAFALGLMVGAVVEAIGFTSGAHINPAVTLGTFIAGEIKLAKAIIYILAQLIGSVFATYFILSDMDQTFDVWYVNCQKQWVSYSTSYCYTYISSQISTYSYALSTRFRTWRTLSRTLKLTWFWWWVYFTRSRSFPFVYMNRYSDSISSSYSAGYSVCQKRTHCYTYSLWHSFSIIRWNLHEYKHYRIIPWPYLASENAVLMVEGLMSFTWVLVSLSVNELRRKGGGASLSGVIVGFTVTACHLASQPLTGAGLNPVRSYGPMYYFDDFTNAWMYWWGPFCGAIIAGVLYRLLLRVP